MRPVLLTLVSVNVEAGKLTRTALAVLDPGSEATLITRRLADSLGLKGTARQIRFESFCDTAILDTETVLLKLKSLNGSYTSDSTGAFCSSQHKPAAS